MSRYIFVTGGVMSGIGKGVAAASIGKVLQGTGLNVSAMKIDPYINVDAGTMNPYIHGEVFVTDDGAETDMDLGTYERFLGISTSKHNSLSTGQIYLQVVYRERQGDFLGKCVQVIPHVTETVKGFIRDAAKETVADILMVEIGGTVGDIECEPFLETARQMRLDEGYSNVLYAHVSWVPYLEMAGEQKTKPTQHSVQELRRVGIQPDFIIGRSQSPLTERTKKKLASFCNVPKENVISSHDIETIYELPLVFNSQEFAERIQERMNLEKRQPDLSDFHAYVEKAKAVTEKVRIALVGKYADLADSYVSVNEALKHAGVKNNRIVEIDWIESEDFEKDPSSLTKLENYGGVLVPGGFGSRGVEGKISTFRYAREHDIPSLGICYGLQLETVEFGRNVCGLEGASSTEIDKDTPHPIIDILPEQRSVDKLGATMRLGAQEIILKEGTLARKLYGKDIISERHRHRYEFNPDYRDRLEKAGLVVSGTAKHDERLAETIELPELKFNFASQFHAEFKSRPWMPSPPYDGFIAAASSRN